MSHHHGNSAAQVGAGRLKVVLLLTATFMVVEVAGGLLTGSLALLADAAHMLTDVFGVSVALVAIWLAARPATTAKTYGWYRLEILAALLNGFLLLIIGGYILWESYQRLHESPDILGAEMIGVAVAGLAVNAAGAALLFEGQKSSLNMRGAFLEVVSDLLGSVAVIIAGLVIVTTGWDFADVIASVVIGALIVPRTWKLIGDAMHVLLEGVPPKVNLQHVRDHILGARGVVGLHDLHVWSLTSGVDVMSAHVVVDENTDSEAVLDELRICLADHFDVDHSTFQIERSDRAEVEHSSH